MHSSSPQPKRLGKYEVNGTIAVGPRWRIYKGFDPTSQLQVALKTISKDVLERSGAFSQMRSELRAAGALEHAGIVRVYGYGEEAGIFYVVMEQAGGWHLKERFRVPIPDAVNLSGQLLEALEYAHELGIVHGEIKPSNLLLTSNGQLRIINFGLSRIGDESPNYKSPEQLNKLPFDRRSDVFSAGLIFYELLTGVHPFAGSAQDVAQRICEGKERPPSQVNAAVPHALDEVSAKSLAKTVNARYPTAQAFCDGIRRAFASADNSHLSRRVSHETIIAFTSPRPEPAHESSAPSRPQAPSTAIPSEPVRQPASVRSPSTPAPSAPNPRPPSPELKPEARPDLKQTPAAAQVTPQVAARLEQLLGKQPENLAGYVHDSSPELDRVVPAFVSTVRALIAMYEAKNRNDALIPQNVHFDQLGKATIQAAQTAAAQATTVMSNPRYAAPEMFSEKGGNADSTTAAANVYALGVMFYEILLGRKKFEQAFPDQHNDIDWMRWHADLESKAPPLRSLLPDCPATLSDLLESMMEKHVEKRPTDLNDILGRLRNVAQRANKTVVLQRPAAAAATPAATPVRKRNNSWLNLFLFLLLVLGIGWVGYQLWQDPDFLREIYQTVVSYFSSLTQKP
jgi:serine/threonine protein kinase